MSDYCSENGKMMFTHCKYVHWSHLHILTIFSLNQICLLTYSPLVCFAKFISFQPPNPRLHLRSADRLHPASFRTSSCRFGVSSRWSHLSADGLHFICHVCVCVCFYVLRLIFGRVGFYLVPPAHLFFKLLFSPSTVLQVLSSSCIFITVIVMC